MTKFETENVYGSYETRDEGEPARLEVLHRFTILRPGWECDEKGLVVRAPSGKPAIAVTTHNGSWYLASPEELKQLLEEHYAYVNDMNTALELMGVTTPETGTTKCHVKTVIPDREGRRDKVLHVSVGAPDWTPTVEDMEQISNLFIEAFVNAPSAVVTRNGVTATILDRDGSREELPTAEIIQLVRDTTND